MCVSRQSENKEEGYSDHFFVHLKACVLVIRWRLTLAFLLGHGYCKVVTYGKMMFKIHLLHCVSG